MLKLFFFIGGATPALPPCCNFDSDSVLTAREASFYLVRVRWKRKAIELTNRIIRTKFQHLGEDEADQSAFPLIIIINITYFCVLVSYVPALMSLTSTCINWACVPSNRNQQYSGFPLCSWPILVSLSVSGLISVEFVLTECVIVWLQFSENIKMKQDILLSENFLLSFPKTSFGIPVVDPGFPRGRGANIRFSQIFPKTVWNFGSRREGAPKILLSRSATGSILFFTKVPFWAH